MSDKNIIKTGSDSVNIQDSQNVTVDNSQNYGLSYVDAKEIALDVFKSNFYKLSGEAADIAIKRVENFTEDLMSKMQAEHEQLLNNFSDPDLQYTLYEAQKTVARKNDKQISELLMELIINRANESDESLLQITLNESIEVMGKLSKRQVDLLTLIFTSFYLTPMLLNYKENLYDFFQNHFMNFYHNDFSAGDYQHFNYTGAAVYSSIGEKNYSQFVLNTHKGFFNRGVDKKEYLKLVGEHECLTRFLIPHINDNERFMPVCSRVDTTKLFVVQEGLTKEAEIELVKIITNNIIPESEVLTFLETAIPFMEPFINYINTSSIKNTELTGVGIVIALTNLKRIGVEYPMEIWIK